MAENPSDLVGKEFIFEYGVDRIFPPSEETSGLFTIKQRAFRRERVVRCRDCKHAAPCPIVNSEKLICELLDEMMVSPRDFCAWGEERDGE